MLTSRSFLQLIVQPSPYAIISRRISAHGCDPRSRAPALDEVGVLGDARGVEIIRMPC